MEMKKILGDKEIDVYFFVRFFEGLVEDIFKGLDIFKKEGLFGDVGVSEMSVVLFEKVYKVSYFLLLMLFYLKMIICIDYFYCY